MLAHFGGERDKAKPKATEYNGNIEKQTYSDVTLYNKNLEVSNPYSGEITLIEASNKSNVVPLQLYTGILNRRDQLYTSYAWEFGNKNYSNYTPSYDVFKEILAGQSTLHSKLLKAEASKLTIGFLKADDALEAFALLRDSHNKIAIVHGYSWVHTQNQSIDSFFAREDVKKELLNSSLDLQNTEVMLLYCFAFYWDIEVMFYDDNSEFIMFMDDKECKILEPWGDPGPYVVEKAGKAYREARLYPVYEILEDSVYLADEYTRKYGLGNAILQGTIDNTIEPSGWVPW